MEFDLFLSYNSANRDDARIVADGLKEKGIRVWFDQYECPPGSQFIRELEKGVAASSLVAVLIGKNDVGPWQEKEYNAALILSNENRKKIVPVLLTDAPEQPEMPLFLRGVTRLDTRGRPPSAVVEGLAQLLSAERAAVEEPLGLGRLFRCKRRLTIWGHTLDKLTQDLEFRQVLLELLLADVKVTVLQLNPRSKYAAAHGPYHALESRSSSTEQHERALQFFRDTFELMTPAQRSNFDVGFANYMPRFRTVVADDVVYLYLYMYGVDVSNSPDLTLRPTSNLSEDGLRQRIISSTDQLARAAEIVPFIKCGQIFPNWSSTKLSSWDSWSADERLRHRTTYDFYVTYAESFHARFGSSLEREVQAHLKKLKGRILVIGCGSGKEAYRFDGHGNSVVAVDFSPVAIGLAKRDPRNRSVQFLLGDFYDLDLMTFEKGETFDGIVANAAFVHLYQRDDIDEILAKVWRRLEPGGVFVLRGLYKERGGIPVNEELDESDDHVKQWGAARWFVYYSRAELAKRASARGFEVIEKATADIAKQELQASGSLMKTILDKGFRHSVFEGVYWPTVLLKKPNRRVSSAAVAPATGIE
jgi:SAM-dependent methyltransferase